MSAKFTPRRNLDRMIATMIVDEVQGFVERTETEAKHNAPGTKAWETARDVFVRRTHQGMDGETLPENLRFKVQAYEWDVQHPGAQAVARNERGGHQHRDAPIAPGVSNYMSGPRDSAASGYVQVVSCRCQLVVDPDGVAKMIGHERAKASGTKVRGVVYAEGKDVIAAEYGDEYPGGWVAEGTHFMRRTVVAMGNRA